MADIKTFPGVVAMSHADDVEKMGPGVDTTSLQDTESCLSVDARLDRAIEWKRDLLLVPVLGLLFLVLFLDRTNIANARIEGLEDGLNMPSNGYNTALWIFYIPFVLADVPSNLILNLGKIKPSWYLGGQMVLLGILSTFQGLTRSYAGLLVVRFLMGVFEASLPAGAAYMLSIYYTKKEAAPRFACFFSFALAGPMFSGLLAYAIENLDGVGGYEGWRWIFIIEGLMTVIFAAMCLVLVPGFPRDAPEWFLKEHERRRLVSRLEASRGQEAKGSAADGVPMWKILLDWRIHLLTMVFFCCDITAASISAFSPTILKELGWTASRAQVMTMPIWVTGIVSTLLITGLATKLDYRWPFMLFAISLQIVGWAIMNVYVPTAGVRYAALFFMSAGTFPQMAICMGWLSANLRGRKYLAVGMAWMFGFGNCANFISSNVFIKAQSPTYPTGFRTGLSFTCLGFALVVLAVVLFTTMNRRRDARRALMSESEKDLDDKVSFRFHV